MALSDNTQDQLSKLLDDLEEWEIGSLQRVIDGASARQTDLKGNRSGTIVRTQYYLTMAAQLRPIGDIIERLAGRDIASIKGLRTDDDVKKDLQKLGTELASFAVVGGLRGRMDDDPGVAGDVIKKIKKIGADELKPVLDSYYQGIRDPLSLPDVQEVVNRVNSLIQTRNQEESFSGCNPLGWVAKILNRNETQQTGSDGPSKK